MSHLRHTKNVLVRRAATRFRPRGQLVALRAGWAFDLRRLRQESAGAWCLASESGRLASQTSGLAKVGMMTGLSETVFGWTGASWAFKVAPRTVKAWTCMISCLPSAPPGETSVLRAPGSVALLPEDRSMRALRKRGSWARPLPAERLELPESGRCARRWASGIEIR